jgi:prophage endopeptidase
MNRIEFTIITAIILFLAFAMGWFAHWLVTRLSRVTTADIGELERLAQSLHDAEDVRDQAIAYIHEREEQFTRETTQLQAELRAAMDGLRDARAQVEALRGRD